MAVVAWLSEYQILGRLHPSGGSDLTNTVPQQELSPDERMSEQSLPGPRWQGWFGNLLKGMPPGSGWCLDLGCGDGEMSEQIGDKGYTWVGLDVAPPLAPPWHRFVCGDGEALPFGACTFKAVFCQQVLEHVRSPQSLLAEAHRVLQPGGVLLGSSSYLEPEHDRACFFHASAHGIEHLLARTGFVGAEITTGIHGPVLVAYHFVGRFGARLLIPAIRFVFEFRCFVWMIWQTVRRGPSEESYRDYRLRKCMEMAGHVIWRARRKE